MTTLKPSPAPTAAEFEQEAEKLVGRFDPDAPARLHAFAPPTAPLTRPEEIEDDEPGALQIARYLLNPELDLSGSFEDLSEVRLPVRRYLSKFNLADQIWIRNPLTGDLQDPYLNWVPHDFSLRHESLHKEYPKPHEREESRRGLALEHLNEALTELHEHITDNDLGNGRLVHAVATAYRGEIRRLVDYLDRGAPAASPEDEAGMSMILKRDAQKMADAAESGYWRGRKAHKRSLLMHDMLRLMGFEVVDGNLGFDCNFVVDTRRRVVTLATGLDSGERTYAKARAIALIRLCLYDLNSGENLAAVQRQMSDYVFELLLPEADMRAAVKEWSNLTPGRLVQTVAREFFVPKRLAKARLESLGFQSERVEAA
ncbi:MAG: hypothetical protein KF760_17810 [Candidatus Eremiobacteraeota bacterium]|nr:hypothetical protein [Candidatus Eremiobacteraeota bacterium]MCW5869237.1 hypothetical protein [Candidatus Eremiobacteraeota bacterium]